MIAQMSALPDAQLTLSKHRSQLLPDNSRDKMMCINKVRYDAAFLWLIIQLDEL